jgi:tetratricopeptide (TPR) repeat protein
VGGRRILRLLGLGFLYFLSLAGKEIGVTLPGVLLLMELAAPRFLEGEAAPLSTRLRREASVFLLLPVVLAGYLGLRFLALGTLTGEITAPIFELLGPEARILTAIALWTQYLRLHLLPADLAADYDPGVFFPSETVDLQVGLGALVLVVLLLAAVKAWEERPLVTLGLAWFAVTISPVSNFFFPTGTVLAERTLYLPSVAFSLVVAGLTPWLLSLPSRPKRLGLALVVLWGLGAFVKTVDRNPSWISTFTVIQTLNEEHPESWRSIRGRAKGLERIGDVSSAAEGWDVAVRLAPLNYTLLVQAGDFHGRVGEWSRGREYLNRAIGLWPTLANAYQILSENLLERGMGREGHRVALEGLARAGPDADLWALVSESYIMKGDLPAAVRARRAAIAADPEDGRQWGRLGDLLEALDDSPGAAEARARARELEAVGDRGDESPLLQDDPALPPGGGGA